MPVRVPLLVVVISAAVVVVEIDTPRAIALSIPLIAPIHGFDYDHDDDRECDPEMNQAMLSTLKLR